MWRHEVPSLTMSLQGCFWGASQSLPVTRPLEFLDSHHGPALSRAQLMPACPALAFWRSGPVAGLCLLPRSQTLLGGAEGCGDRRPLPPPLTY